MTQCHWASLLYFLCLFLFQAEHHARAMQNVPGVTFYRDEKRGRVGMLTTLQVKHAMCTLLNAMLRYACSPQCAMLSEKCQLRPE